MNGITRAVKRMEVGKGRKMKQGARQGWRGAICTLGLTAWPLCNNLGLMVFCSVLFDSILEFPIDTFFETPTYSCLTCP